MTDRLDRWLFEEYRSSPYDLAAFRIAYALLALVAVAPGAGPYARFHALGRLPDALFAPPPGPMMVFGGFPPEALLLCVEIGLTAGLVALLVGYRTPLASVLVGVGWLVGFGFSYSLGKVNHNLIFVLAPLIMAGSGWGERCSVDTARRRDRPQTPPERGAWRLALLALLVGFGWATAGASKLVGGWLDPSSSAAQGHFLRQVYVNGRADLLAARVANAEGGVPWKLMDWGTVAFEIGFVVAVLRGAWMRAYVVLALFFHTTTLLLMNIAFVPMLAVYPAFMGLGRHAQRIERWAGPRLAKAARREPVVLVGVALLAAMIFGVNRAAFWHHPPPSFSSDLSGMEVVVGLAFGCLALWRTGKTIWGRWRKQDAA